ncbi:MAG: accessory gene regulator B family protein [Clostridiales bacterium]|nr:accessory gene regulator B family protein [Clostridiales bacterium]
MFYRRISVGLTARMISAGVVKEEDRDVYQYSIEVVAALIVNFVSALILFLVFGRLSEGLIFFAVFFPLRTYSGGYHASTHLKCYLISMALMLAVIFCLNNTSQTDYYMLSAVLGLFSILTVFMLAPVEDKNRPLDDKEIAVYRGKSLKLLAVDGAALILLLIFRMEFYAYVVSLGLSVTAASIIVAKLNRLISTKIIIEK